MSSSSSSNLSKTTSSHKIPQFDEKNFTIWKSKAIKVLETMDYSTLNIVNGGPYAPMYNSIKSNVKEGDKVKNLLMKRLQNLFMNLMMKISVLLLLMSKFVLPKEMLIPMTYTIWFKLQICEGDDGHADGCV